HLARLRELHREAAQARRGFRLRELIPRSSPARHSAPGRPSRDNVSMTDTVKLRSRPSAEKRRPSVFWVLACAILPAWSLMVRYRFTPESKLPKTGPFILAPNHYSEIDPIAMGAAVWHLGRLPRF